MPKGYLIAHVTVTDAEAYKAYTSRNNSLIPQFGGRFLARGGRSDNLEGANFKRHVIIEFDSYDAAMTFYNSPEYQENLKVRLANAAGTVSVVEGYDG